MQYIYCAYTLVVRIGEGQQAMTGTFGRWLVGRLCGLRPRSHRRLTVERDVSVPMADGVSLIADIYVPANDGEWPVILTRCPYGRGSMFAAMASLLAERGYRVILQSVRGTAGSGGRFDPMRQERSDGADTIDWVRAQPWFAGTLYTFGGSYLGNVQWAMASINPGAIDAAAMAVTLSNFCDELRNGGGYTLEGTLAWSLTMQAQTNVEMGRRGFRAKLRELKNAHGALPLGTVDQAAFGRTVPWLQDWIGHDDPHEPWWQGHDYSAGVTALDAPVSAVAGWRDIFLPFQLRDFMARQQAGKPTWLTIGPWAHASPGGTVASLKTALELFDSRGRGDASNGGRAKVRLYLQQSGKWREFPSWPPPDGVVQELPLRSNGLLGAASSPPGRVTFVYDPEDPTPSLHGPQIMGAARKPDMSAIEKRADTVSFTGPPLDNDLDLIGPVEVDLAVSGDSEQCDFYVCLCDVGKDGRPMHITDGYVRLRPVAAPDSLANARQITIECWPTGYRVKRGHRLRLLVAGGAFPRFARNSGTAEPIATGTTLRKTTQEILIGGDHNSCLRVLQVPSC